MTAIMKARKLFIISALSVGLLATATAAPVTINNFSFETGGSAPNGVLDPGSGTLAGWDYTRTGVLPATLTDVSFGASGLATNGSNVAELQFLAGVLANVGIFQNTGVSFLPNSIYTLSFDIDQRSVASLLNGASAALYEGTNVVASMSGGSLLTLLDGSGGLQPVSFQYTTGAVAPSGTIGIGFSAGGVAEVLGAGLIIDNVRLDVVPVPEPGTALMIAMAGGWLHLVSRRRRRIAQA